DLGSIGTVTNNLDGTYSATLTSHTTGTAHVSGKLGATDIGHGASVTFTPGAAAGATTLITASPTSVSVDVGSSAITVQAKDQYGNNLTSGGGTVSLSADHGSLSSVTDNLDGTYSATLSDTVTRLDTVSGSINTHAITDTASVTFTPGAAAGATTLITASPTSVSVDVGSTSEAP